MFLQIITILGMIISLTTMVLGVATVVFGIISLFTKDFDQLKKIAKWFGISLLGFIIVLGVFTLSSALSLSL